MRSGFRRAVLAVLVGAVWLVTVPGSAAAFGTIDGGGQRREHERITRAALACTGSADDECFAPATLDVLAGQGKDFGAVGAPDSDELSDPAAHCDDADYLRLDPAYPQTRAAATAGLVACVDHLQGRFAEGVDAAAGLLDAQGLLIPAEVAVGTRCRPGDGGDLRAKCAALGGFGRVLHGVQDFYAHSNWADEADPNQPLGDENPPGLGLRGPSPLLDMRATTAPDVPTDLSTGCFVPRDEIPGVAACTARITHAALNKDRGLIDPVTGATSDPTTPRGMAGDNFAAAVAGAIAETRRQWEDFTDALDDRYGRDRGELMACALTRDDPATECATTGTSPVVLIVVGVGGALVLGAGIALVVVLRRRRARQG